ncbi:hypothetical protein HAX54_052554, partial [Datura stramonium]|nr:hypothetical protein [Datura stramonium]
MVMGDDVVVRVGRRRERKTEGDRVFGRSRWLRGCFFLSEFAGSYGGYEVLVVGGFGGAEQEEKGVKGDVGLEMKARGLVVRWLFSGRLLESSGGEKRK